MNPNDPTTTAAPPTPDAYIHLADLCEGWLEPSRKDYHVVAPDQVPAPFHDLLVHNEHMTEILQKHYNQPVHLHVQDLVHRPAPTGGTYRRRITLTAGPIGPITELGIVDLNLAYLPKEAQQEILAKSAPLGQILINHQILRQVVPHHYVKFEPNTPLLKLFNHTTKTPIYGRLATILCNDQPAIELLEIATGVPI
jgi:hypothetical protein